jgi:hypothetical protein
VLSGIPDVECAGFRYDAESNPVLPGIIQITHVVLLPLKIVCISSCFLLWKRLGRFDRIATDYFFDSPALGFGVCEPKPFLRAVTGAFDQRFGYRITHRIAYMTMYAVPILICVSLGMLNSAFRQNVHIMMDRGMGLADHGLTEAQTSVAAIGFANRFAFPVLRLATIIAACFWIPTNKWPLGISFDGRRLQLWPKCAEVSVMAAMLGVGLSFIYGYGKPSISIIIHVFYFSVEATLIAGSGMWIQYARTNRYLRARNLLEDLVPPIIFILFAVSSALNDLSRHHLI